MRFKKLNKTQARKLYNAGQTIMLVPCKVNPNNMWGIGHYFSNAEGDGFERDFDKVVSYYSYYNCQYNELGKYCAYYIEEETA